MSLEKQPQIAMHQRLLNTPTHPAQVPHLASLGPEARGATSTRCVEERRFVVHLATALHKAGVPAPELEDSVNALGSSLGQTAVALASPTSLFLSFPGEGTPELHLERVDPGETNLGRQVALDALARGVRGGRVSPARGLEKLHSIEDEGPQWTRIPQAAAFALAALAASIFFETSLSDAVAAGLLGLGVGLAGIVIQGRARLAQLFEAASALATTLGALALARLGFVTAPESVALAALIVLVPGYSLTVALSELAQRHLTSGTTRLFGALGSFLGLGLGVGLGSVVGQSLFGQASFVDLPQVQPAWAVVLALLATPLAFGVLLQVAPRHLGWVTLGGLVSFGGARLGSLAVGPEFGAGVGALLLGATSNLVARRAHLPASMVLVPGILLLVPGSVGYRSVTQFLQHDTVAGMETAFRVAYVGATLVGGLLAAHALVPSQFQSSQFQSSSATLSLPEDQPG